MHGEGLGGGGARVGSPGLVRGRADMPDHIFRMDGGQRISIPEMVRRPPRQPASIVDFGNHRPGLKLPTWLDHRYRTNLGPSKIYPVLCDVGCFAPCSAGRRPANTDARTTDLAQNCRNPLRTLSVVKPYRLHKRIEDRFPTSSSRLTIDRFSIKKAVGNAVWP